LDYPGALILKCSVAYDGQKRATKPELEPEQPHGGGPMLPWAALAGCLLLLLDIAPGIRSEAVSDACLAYAGSSLKRRAA